MPLVSNFGIKFLKEHWAFSLVLLLALINGMFYVFLIPPWQHYDEPGHFEFAWLIANQNRLPVPGDFDQTMHQELAASMIEHKFFQDMGFQPNLVSQSEPIWIGIPQINDRPLYYFLVAFPLYMVKTASIDLQLHLGRLVSLVLYLVTIIAAYGFMRELTNVNNPLRLIVPATIVLLPGFTDLMTAINDDVGATAFFSLFLWMGVRLIKRGFSWPRFVFLTGLVAICFWTKNNLTICILLWVIPVLFSVFRESQQRVSWTILAGIVLLGLGSIFAWGDAAYWYRATGQEPPTRNGDGQTVLGENVLRLQITHQVGVSGFHALYQPLAPETVQKLAGKTITIGSWMWASRPVEINAPKLRDGGHSFGGRVSLGTEPRFYTYTLTLSEEISRLWLALAPGIKASEQDVDVYYDGLVLVIGNHPSGTAPNFGDARGESGDWGGKKFENLIRNPSAELSGPRVRSWLDNLWMRWFPEYERPSLFLTYLLDWSTVKWHYEVVGARLFRTFWGMFGWGNVPLIGHKPYRVLLYFALIGLLGAVLSVRSKVKYYNWEIFVFLGLSLLGIYALAFSRGAVHLFTDSFYLPVARYAFPAIIPTVLILSTGWWEIIKIINQAISIPEWGKHGLYFGLLLGFDMIAVISILRYF